MSDPVSNAAVEDVLASIRRLVSEEKRPVAFAEEPDETVSTDVPTSVSSAPKDKLLLTPAQRVPEAGAEAVDEDGPKLTDLPYIEPDDEIAGKTFEFNPLHVDEGDDEALEDGAEREIEAESDRFDDDPDDGPYLTSEESTEPDAEAAELLDQSPLYVSEEDSFTDASVLEFRTGLTASRTDTLDEQSSDDAESSESADAFDADAVADAHSLVSETALDAAGAEGDVPEEADAESADVDIVGVDDDSAALDDSFDPAPRPGIDVPIALSAKIAALEAVIGKRADQWEPDGVAEDPYSGTEDPTMAWEDHTPGAEFAEVEGITAEAKAPAEADVPSETEVVLDADVAPYVDVAAYADIATETVAAVAEDPSTSEEMTTVDDAVAEDDRDWYDAATDQDDAVTSSNDDTTDLAGTGEINEEEAKSILTSDVDILDEDTLRDLVSDIVRQELQGALGERITRNVRKLVRREIHRALATQDLE